MKLVSTYLKNIAICTVVVFSLIFTSCSKRIEIERFEGNSQVKAGEDAVLQWKFNKADYVLIEGFKEQMPPEGTLNVKTEKSKTYKFTAVNYFDTLQAEWAVNVTNEIKTGAESAAFPEMKESFKLSPYLTGFAGAEGEYEPDRIKVMRTYSDEISACKARFIVLDQYGNYLRGMASPEILHTISSVKGSNLPTSLLTEKWTSAPEKQLNVHILADNSAAAERNIEVLKALKDFSTEYRLVDKYSFAWFNNSEYLEYNLPQDENVSFNSIDNPMPNGFNSIFKYTFNYLNSPESSISELNNILIMFLFSSDNASIFYDAEDVAKLAKQTGTAIYPITIGTAVNSHSLKYLAEYSGGRLYSIDDNSIESIKNIVHEIVFAQKSYFELRFDNQEFMDNKPLVLSLQKGETKLMDNFRLIGKPEAQFADYQAIAGFGFKDTVVSPGFLPAINDLANVMKSNPSITVELIGHSGIEGNEAVTYELALVRAQIVRRMLLAEGVPSSQIRVVSEGSSKPVYYMENFSWQSVYNRRVELRWIVPEQLPFEILAEVCPSEEQALTKVESWEKIGYKSYYERFLKNNNPQYRVKIWGFATESEAEEIVTKLKVKHKIDFAVR